MGTKPETLSPYHHLTAKLPPTLILHGKADTTVPYATVEAFQKQAEKMKAPCKLVGYEGAQHGFFNFGRNTPYYENHPRRDGQVLEVARLSDELS